MSEEHDYGDLDALVPGRTLDALVAETVMGMGSQWAVHQNSDGTFTPTGDVWYQCPEFSTDIHDAWQVVKRMEKSWWCQMRTPFEGANSDGYWAGFTPHSTTGWNGTPDHWTQADTMPMAICLSALKAMGVLD